MKKIFLFLLISFILFLSGCEETITPDITSNGLIYYIGSSIDDVTEKVSITGIDELDETTLVVDTSFVNIYKPGEYTIVFTILRGDKVEFRKSLQLNITDIPLTDHPEINYAKDIIYVVGNDEPNYFETVTATDRIYGNLTTSVVVDSSQVDYETPGSYVVNYFVKNNDDYYGYKNINVHVVDNKALPELPDEFFIVVQNDLYGMLDIDGNTILDYEFDDIIYLQDSVVKLFKFGNPYYYNFDEAKYFTLPVEITSNFNNGIARVQNLVEEYGYVNSIGEKVIICGYDVARQLTTNYILVSLDGLYGVLDLDGNPILEILYDDIYHLEDNLFVTRQGDVSNIITLEGDILFSADIIQKARLTIDTHTYHIIQENGLLGLIDDDQVQVLNPTYKEIIQVQNLVIAINENNTIDIYNPVNDRLIESLYSYSIIDNYIMINSELGYGILDIDLHTLIPSTYQSLEHYTDDLFIAKNNELFYGIIDISNTEILSFEYTEVHIQNNNLIIITDSFNKSHLVNEEGTIISAFDYKKIHNFSNGYAIVQDDLNYYGMINEEGIEVLDRDYYYLTEFVDGYAKTYTSASQNESAWGVIDMNFDIIIPNQYSFISDVEENTFIVRASNDSNSSGYINTEGKIILPLIFKEVLPFTEGYGRVILQDGSYKIVNTKGQFITDTSYHYISEFTDGYSVVSRTAASGSNCLINTSGELVTECIYDSINPFYDGFAVIENEFGSNYINIDGELLLNEYASYAEDFIHGVGIIIQDGSYKMINKSGYVLIDDKKEITSSESSDLFLVKEQTDLFGYYNPLGIHTITSKYSMAESFVGNYGFVCTETFHCGVIDPLGNEILPLQYSFKGHNGTQYYVLYNNIEYTIDIEVEYLNKHSRTNPNYILQYITDWSVIDQDDVLLSSFAIDDITFGIGNTLTLHLDNYFGLGHIDGRVFVLPQYDDILYRSNYNFIIVVIDDQYGLVDLDHNEIIEPQFTNIEHLYQQEYYLVYTGELVGVYNQDGEIILDLLYQSITHHIK